MGLTSKSSLFELVARLTPSEKRYLRQSINKQGEAKGNHAKLFEAIAKQTVYDEEKLKKKFRGTSIDKQWSRVKNYLYNYILKVLQNYYQQDGEFEIYSNLQQIAILYKKGIFEEAYRLLIKTKTAASKGVFTSLLPFIAEWEMRLGMVRYDESGEEQLINDDENNKWAIDVTENSLMYYRYQKEILTNRLKKRYLDMETVNLKLLNSPIYASPDLAKSPYAKLMFFIGKSTLYDQVGQFKAGYVEAKNAIELYKKAPLLWVQAPLSYLTVINTCLFGAIETRKWEEVGGIIEEIEAAIQKNRGQMINVTLMSMKYIALLKKCIGTMEFEKGITYVEEIEAFIKKHEGVPERYVQPYLLWHYLVHIYIINGEYQEALNLIEKLEKIQRMPIFVNALMLLKLICLFELDEVFLLPYAVRSIYRSLLKKKNLYEFERIILNLLKASVNIKSKTDLQLVFQRYWIKFKDFASTAPKAELELLEHFNYIAWIESKVRGIPLINILKNEFDPSDDYYEQVKKAMEETLNKGA